VTAVLLMPQQGPVPRGEARKEGISIRTVAGTLIDAPAVHREDTLGDAVTATVQISKSEAKVHDCGCARRCDTDRLAELEDDQLDGTPPAISALNTPALDDPGRLLTGGRQNEHQLDANCAAGRASSEHATDQASSPA
jgi:hypothetical protein